MVINNLIKECDMKRICEKIILCRSSLKSLLPLAIASFMFFIILSCDNKADLNDPIGKSDAKPLPVTVTKIENISGAAVIEYELPKDDNLNYVEAVYEINGRETKTKGSFYTSILTLEGFPEAQDYSV